LTELCPSIDFQSVQDVENEQRKEFGLPVAPAQIEIPRKAKLFRVLMERKLGIDWEHTVKSS
jgi:hypothetical protein